jgi:hypothetical protein
MRCPRLLPAAALTGALLLGCADEQSPTPTADPTGPSLSAERGTAEFASAFADDRYSIVVGLTFEDVVGICEGRLPPPPTWDQLTVTRPEGQDDFRESIKQLTRAKDLPITIFEFSPFPFGHECDLLGAPRLEGTGQAFIADNDVFLTHNGANAFNLRVTGTVTDESGQPYHLEVRVLGVLSRETISLNGFLKIQLTSIGG